jgi:hypothetical protein
VYQFHLHSLIIPLCNHNCTYQCRQEQDRYHLERQNEIPHQKLTQIGGIGTGDLGIFLDRESAQFVVGCYGKDSYPNKTYRYQKRGAGFDLCRCDFDFNDICSYADRTTDKLQY